MNLTLEFSWRYCKYHKTFQQLGGILMEPPKNIPNIDRTPFKLAMGSNPECMDQTNPVESYRRFYETKQDRFDMKWTKREVPSWFKQKAKV
jgi:hypothetical protein